MRVWWGGCVFDILYVGGRQRAPRGHGFGVRRGEGGAGDRGDGSGEEASCTMARRGKCAAEELMAEGDAGGGIEGSDAPAAGVWRAAQSGAVVVVRVRAEA